MAPRHLVLIFVQLRARRTLFFVSNPVTTINRGVAIGSGMAEGDTGWRFKGENDHDDE